MKKYFCVILCLIPMILLSLTFEFEKVNEFAASGDFGQFHRLLIEDNYLYAISIYGFEINTVNEISGALNRISLIPLEGDVDGIEKIGNSVFVSVSTHNNLLDEINSELYKIDVSNPYDPFIVDSIIFPENIKNSVIGTYGDFLGYHKLENINNTWFFTQLVFVNPITFEEITSYIIHTLTVKLKENYFIQQRDLYGYVFDVYDYSDIFNIQLVGSVDFESGQPYFSAIHAIDDSTLVLLGNESITFYNISDIFNIELLSTYYTYNNSSPLGDCIRIEDFLIIPTQAAGIEVVDISDIANPIMFDFWEYPKEDISSINPYFYTTGGLIYNNGHLYIGTFYDGILLMNFDNGIIEYVDKFINNRINSLKHRVHNNQLISNGYSGGLYVYDLEEVVSSTLNMIIFEDLFVTDFEVINNYIYLTTFSKTDEEYYFKIFNISDLSNPILQLDELLNGLSYFMINENEPDYLYICSIIGMISVEIVKYNISNPENIEQVLFYDIQGIVEPVFFYEGYLYVEEWDDRMKNLLIYNGFEEENPELVNQILNFVSSSQIYKVNNYLNVSRNSNIEGDLFYNLDDPINPELVFTTPISSKWRGCKLKDNVLFSPSGYTVYLYSLEGNPSGELEPFGYFNLNSRYKNITFFSQDNEDYFFCEQLECIITYNYLIETSVEDELPKPEFTLSNYPNPFNPETTISFELNTETTENTELVIYNLKGQKVKDLSPSLCHPEPVEGRGGSRYSVVWDGTDSNSKKVASGLYFYKLRIDNKTEVVKKCMLLK